MAIHPHREETLVSKDHSETTEPQHAPDAFESHEMPSVIWSHPAFRLFVNSVVAVSTRAVDTVNAMSAEWCTPVSIDPVLLGVLVGHTRWTHALIGESSQVGLSLLAEDQATIAHDLGDSSGRSNDKLGANGPAWFSGPILGLPLIEGAAAHFECHVVAVHTVGDHDLIIGSPVWSATTILAKPLVYHRGHYYQLPEPLRKPES